MPLVDARTPTELLHRVGRLPPPLDFTPWAYSGGGRYDDPLGKATGDPPGGRFRTLYACERRMCSFIECIAGFRLDPLTEAAMHPMVPETMDPDALSEAGIVTLDWRQRHAMQTLHLAPDQRWLDVREMETVQLLRGVFAKMLAELGLPDLDNSIIRSVNRRLTQAIGRWAYERGYAGVAYRSRYNDSCDAWALFEGRAQFAPVGSPEPVRHDDPDLVAAARLLRLSIA
ncbi:MAG: RES domain-containing protein [Chloroflexi bacterium]|nr:RES domain-containing protein [Chloroflexota bacterium]